MKSFNLTKFESFFSSARLAQLLSRTRSKNVNTQILELVESQRKLNKYLQSLLNDFHEHLFCERQKYNRLLDVFKRNEKLKNLKKEADFQVLLIEDCPNFRQKFRDIIEEAFDILNLTASIVETDNINDAEMLCCSCEFNLIVTDLNLHYECMSKVLKEHQDLITKNVFIVSASSKYSFESIVYKKWLTKHFDVEMMKKSILEIHSNLESGKVLCR